MGNSCSPVFQNSKAVITYSVMLILGDLKPYIYNLFPPILGNLKSLIFPLFPSVLGDLKTIDFPSVSFNIQLENKNH